MSQTIPSSSAQPLLIRAAQLLGGEVCDVRIADGRITALAPALATQANDFILEAGGNLLLPGLQDHHLHLFATASARASVHCGPPQVNNPAQLQDALQQAAGAGWLRGVGFHDSVCPDLNRHWLDQVCPNRPLRIQHRSGMMWVFNSAALRELATQPPFNGQEESQWPLPDGAERDARGLLTGRFYNLDTWLGQHLPRAWPSLTELSRELASYGITGVTDTGVNNDGDVWAALTAASDRGELLQRVKVMGSERLNGMAATAKLDTGPLKLYLREIALPELDAFSDRIARAHQHHRAVAVHCVTRVEMIFVLEAFAEAGVLPGDRIEHASIADDGIVQRMAELGILAVTQPHFIAERGDQYLQDVEADDIPWLYRGAGFFRHGARLAAGSDAPYGSPNPWVAMQAAVNRQTRSGVVMGADERLTPLQALGLFGGTLALPGGGTSRLTVGQPADLCLLDTTWESLAADLCADHVMLTLCAGDVIYQAAHFKLAGNLNRAETFDPAARFNRR